MPRMSFSNTALRSATPGLSRLASAIGGGQDAYNQGYDQETMTQTKLAQSLAQMRQLDSAAALNSEKAASENAGRAVLERRPQLYEEQVAAASGADIPLVQAIRKSLQTGNAPAISDMGPPAEDGSMGARAVDPAVRTKIAGALQQFLPLLTNTNDLKPDDLAQAAKLYRESGLSDAVINGTLDRNKVGGAQAAVAGKPIYNADSTGAVLDQYGGALDTSNPLAGASIALRKAQEGAQRANAVQSYAAAENSRASAAKTRADAADGMGAGGRAPTGYRWNGAALEPIPGGPADPATKGAKLSKPPTEGQAKALLFAARMEVADQIMNELSDKALRPGGIKGAAQGVAGAIPLVGDSLSAGVGNALNWTQSDAQQQVEQARRDFINAVLRRESGAAIGASEFASADQQYFPQPGDSKALIEQKAQARRTAIEGLKAEFGEPLLPDFEKIVGQAKQTRSPKKLSANPGGGTVGNQPAPPASTARNIVVDF